MQNKPIRNVYKCRLEALTPLHVGSGETLRSGFDFFVDSRRIHVVNTARLFRKVQKIGNLRQSHLSCIFCLPQSKYLPILFQGFLVALI